MARGWGPDCRWSTRAVTSGRGAILGARWWAAAALGASAALSCAARGGSGAPIEPPGPGAAGCVESPELKAFVQALEAERSRARGQALSQLGASERARPSRFVEGAPPLGSEVRASDGQRLVVVARLATSTPPLIPLAERQPGQLQPIEELPRAHPVAVRACGVNTCPAPERPQLPPLRSVAVALAPGEQLGPPLQLSYDYWWAQVSYDRSRSCPPPPPSPAPPAGGAGVR